MKKILGLDIGTTSIGWAIVEATDERKVNEKTNEIAAGDINNDRLGIHKDAVGVRIISQDTANILSFNKGEKLIHGSTLTPTANRRVKRSSRRCKSRYILRRGKLENVLSFLRITKDEKYYTNERKNDADGKRIKRGENNDIGKAIYELRDKANKDKISLPELGRVLLHLNQWRGYSSDRFKSTEKQETTAGITAKVIRIEKGENYTANKIIKKKEVEITYNTFIIEFDNGDKVIEIRLKENIESDFKLNELYTYSFENNEEVHGLKQVTKKKLDENSWAFKKEKINSSIQEWCNAGETLGSYFHHNFYKQRNIERIRNNVVDREWYEKEFDKVWSLQFENHKDFFERINIEEVVKAGFKDYQPILNEVMKNDGIKEQLKCLIKDKIIFYQRPWQQAKNKGQCPFEKILVKKEQTLKGTGKREIVEVHIGRTVIPRSHPLFQEFKIWQQINNLRLFYNAEGKIDLFENAEVFKQLTGKEILEVKQMLYEELQKSKTLSWRIFVKDRLKLNTFEDLENIKKSKKKGIDTETGELTNTYFSVNFRKRKKDGTWEDIKLKGNTTKVSLKNILADKTDEWFNSIYKKGKDNPYKTKAKKEEFNYKVCEYTISNLQLLWETIYDITLFDKEKLRNIIANKFPDNTFSVEQLTALSKLKFDDAGMGNLSAKAIRNILPIMSNGDNLTNKARKKIDSLVALNQSEEEKAKGKDEKLEILKNFIIDKKARLRLSQFNNQSAFTYLNYWEATAVMYGSHSSKQTEMKKEIHRVRNHSMNNPVVEKIVNETISIVNEIYTRYGFDEVRIELSRELKASMDERQQMWEAMTANADKNEWAKQMLRELKVAIIEDNRNADNIDDSAVTNSNIDKIKIIEDVVKYQFQDEYKRKVKEYKLDEPSKKEVTKYLLWLEQNFKCPYTNQPIPLTDVFAKGKVVEIEHILPRERYYSNAYSNKVITWHEVNQAKANNGNRTAFEFIVSKRVEETVKVGNKEISLIAKEDWEEHIKAMFPKGSKRNNLLRKEIPEDPINRTLNETQYINKKLKEKLAELIGEQNVWVTSGSVTDILRERWHLNNVMKELMRRRFENFEIPTGKKTFTLKTIEEQEKMVDDINQALKSEAFEIFKIFSGKKSIEIKERGELEKISEELKNKIRDNADSPNKLKPYKYSSAEESSETKSLTYWTKEYNSKSNEYRDVEKFEGFSKRLDHRHHALDAIIIACTKQNHIQYINTLNAINTADRECDESKKAKYTFIKNNVCIGNSNKKFLVPWNHEGFIIDEKNEKYNDDKFFVDVKKAMNNLIISHKNIRLLISPSKNKFGQNKVASIRGELHKETNYAKKNYFEGARTPIKKLIPNILKLKEENQHQSMVHFKKFDEIIRETVLKEKYQNVIIPLFEKYDKEKLNDSSRKEFSKAILNEIETKALLIDSKTNKPLEWLSTYSEKDKSARPNGLSMDLNSKTAKIDEVKSIADPRVKRIAEYRRNLIIVRKKEIDDIDLPKTEKDKLKRKIETLPLYSNAIYEVRVKRGTDKFEWIELKDFNWNDLDRIEYAKTETTQFVKNKLQEVDFEKLKTSYFDNPIFLSATPILIKKVRQKSYFQELYEVTKGRYVYSSEMFMTYFFKNKNDEKQNAKREIKFLKYIDAISIISAEKPEQIDYKKLIEKEKSNAQLLNDIEYDLLFTLSKNDLVYLPDKNEDVEKINWQNINSIASKLFIVKDMNPSDGNKKIKFQQFYIADAIKISEADAKSLFQNPELREQTEEIKYGVIEMLQTCIKVFTDKLGKKVVPYWEFPNGCWDKNKAKSLGLTN